VGFIECKRKVLLNASVKINRLNKTDTLTWELIGTVTWVYTNTLTWELNRYRPDRTGRTDRTHFKSFNNGKIGKIYTLLTSEQ